MKAKQVCKLQENLAKEAIAYLMESSFIGMMGAEDETGEEICTGMMM